MSKKVLGFTSRKWLCFFTGLLAGVVMGGLAGLRGSANGRGAFDRGEKQARPTGEARPTNGRSEADQRAKRDRPTGLEGLPNSTVGLGDKERKRKQ